MAKMECDYFEVRTTGVWRCTREYHGWMSHRAENKANHLRRKGVVINPDRHVMVNTGMPDTEIIPVPVYYNPDEDGDD